MKRLPAASLLKSKDVVNNGTVAPVGGSACELTKEVDTCTLVQHAVGFGMCWNAALFSVVSGVPVVAVHRTVVYSTCRVHW